MKAVFLFIGDKLGMCTSTHFKTFVVCLFGAKYYFAKEKKTHY